MTEERLGELPKGYFKLITDIRGGQSNIEEARETLAKWAGDNPYRLNQIEADLEPLFSPEQSGYGTNPITPSSKGTGLPEQVKPPRDLRG